MTDIDKNPLLNPFSDKILYTRVLVPCNKLNTDIYINLKNLLKKQIEGKCIKYGYVSKIFKILDYSNNTIDINNLDCSVFYNIKYSARLCFPIENTIIIARITTMNKQFFVAENGPITNMIKYTSLDLNNFKLTDDHNIIVKKDKTTLVSGTFVKILIQAKKMYNGDNKIGTLSYLIDIAKPKEINEFYEKKNLTEDLFDVMNIDNNETESEEEYEDEDQVISDNKKTIGSNEIINKDSDNEEEESNTNFISI